MSRSRCLRGRWWRWWGVAARASPPSSTCWSISTSRPAGEWVPNCRQGGSIFLVGVLVRGLVGRRGAPETEDRPRGRFRARCVRAQHLRNIWERVKPFVTSWADDGLVCATHVCEPSKITLDRCTPTEYHHPLRPSIAKRGLMCLERAWYLATSSGIDHLLMHCTARVQVCLDGIDICSLDHRWLHRTIGLVGQVRYRTTCTCERRDEIIV